MSFDPRRRSQGSSVPYVAILAKYLASITYPGMEVDGEGSGMLRNVILKDNSTFMFRVIYPLLKEEF